MDEGENSSGSDSSSTKEYFDPGAVIGINGIPVFPLSLTATSSTESKKLINDSAVPTHSNIKSDGNDVIKETSSTNLSVNSISSSAKLSVEPKKSQSAATCTLTSSGIHISRLPAPIIQDVPLINNGLDVSLSSNKIFKNADNSIQKNGTSLATDLSKNVVENGKVVEQQKAESFSSESHSESDSPDGTDSDIRLNIDKIVPKLVIKDIPKPTIPENLISNGDTTFGSENNAPLDLCVKSSSSVSLVIPSNVNVIYSSASQQVQPSINVVSVQSNNTPVDINLPSSKSVVHAKSNKSATEAVTITKITSESNENYGVKKGPKPKYRKISLAPLTDEELKVRRQKQEELRQHLEAELRHQQLQLKIAKRLALQKEKELGLKVSSNESLSPKKRGRPAKSNSAQQVPVPATTSTMSKQKCHNKGLLKSSVNNSVNITSPTGSKDSSRIANKDDELATNDDASSSSGGSSSSECGASSATDSDSDDDGDTNTQSDVSHDEKSKQLKQSSDNSAPSPKKRMVLSEKAIRIPCQQGWRRETRIRCLSQSGVRGEVSYFAPCGKKLKAYPEISRYLEKYGISNITRDNFSFSSKYTVGEFLEPVPGGGPNDYNLVNEKEMIARLDEFRAKKRNRGKRGRPPMLLEEQDAQPSSKKKSEFRRRIRDSKQADDVIASKRKRLEKERALALIKEAKRAQAVDEQKRQRDLNKMMKMQDKMDRIEMHKNQQELKIRQLMEERERKRQQEILMKEQELQKQREIMMVLDLERERRRQHMILVKALEARKKQEEMEKKFQEQRELEYQRKMEQQRIDLQVMLEMKKPTEDMAIKNQKPMPTLNRIPGVKIPGQAFGNTLLAFEFLHNFGETLGFDMAKLPTLNTLQMALLNDEECEEELYYVLHHLITCALDDPGLPKYPKTHLGQSLKDVCITRFNISEVMRLYFFVNFGADNQMHKWLKDYSYFALNATQKSDILAFFCDELVGSRSISRQIDNSIEASACYRRDKWVVEGELRNFRAIQARKRLRAIGNEALIGQNSYSREKIEVKKEEKDEEVISVSTPIKTMESNRSTPISAIKDGADDMVGNESGNDSDATQHSQLPQSILPPGILAVNEEDDKMTLEEVDKKIEKLTKQWKQVSSKLQKSLHSMRAMSFGQDRYRRRYWVLPASGGVYVESVESSEPPGGDNFYLSNPSTVDDEAEEGEEDDDVEKSEDTSKCEHIAVKEEHKNKMTDHSVRAIVDCDDDKDVRTTNDEDDIESLGELKIVEDDTDSCQDKSQDIGEQKIGVDSKPEKSGDKKSCEIFKVNDINAVIKSPNHKESTDLPQTKNESSVNNKNALPPNLTHSQPSSTFNPFMDPSLFLNDSMNKDVDSASVLGMFGKFDSPLAQNTAVNPFTANLMSTAFAFNAEQVMKGFGSNKESSNDSKPWFSLLPRLPCDDTSFTRSPSSSISSGTDVTKANACQTDLHSPFASSNNFINYAALPMMNIVGSQNFMSPASMFAAPGPFNNPFSSVFPQFVVPGMTFNPPLSTTPSVSIMPCTAATTTLANALNLCIPTPTSSINVSSSIYNSSEPIPEDIQVAVLDRLRQYKKPKPIPSELTRGWWRITDEVQVRSLFKSLHNRGLREKTLYKALDKYMQLACESCARGKQEEIGLSITDLDREISQKLGGAPDPDQEGVMDPELNAKIATSVLELVEAIELRVFSASMHVKGWKLPPKYTSEDSVIMCIGHHSDLDELLGYVNNDTDKTSEDDDDLVTTESIVDNHSESKSDVEKITEDLDNIKKSEESVCEEASKYSESVELQTESKEENFAAEDTAKKPPRKVCPILLAKERVANLEAAIERRYLKPPLARQISSQAALISSYNEDDIPHGLNMWRLGIQKATSAAQVAMCIHSLDNCIAWDKSIMKASCQFCHSGDNEGMLLLCDNCDKGYHTYCFKPEMDKIPEGDWYCYQCLNKVTGDRLCCLCGTKGRQMITCDNCPKLFHLECVELTKQPRGRWNCPCCTFRVSNTNRVKRRRKLKESKENKGNAEVSEDSKPVKAMSEKEKNSRYISVCKVVIGELESHEDSWPFLLPVNTKQFPSYKKIIKKPMDLSTIKTKLSDGQYNIKEELMSDVMQMFDNCETFNEDDSPVGKAGHNLRSFFLSRMSELCAKISCCS